MPYTLLVTAVMETENWDGHIVTQYSHCTKAFFTLKLPYGSTVHRTQPTRRAQPSLTHLTNAQQHYLHHLYQISAKLGNKCEEGDTNSLTPRSKCGLRSADLHETPLTHKIMWTSHVPELSKFGNNRRQLASRAAQLSQHTMSLTPLAPGLNSRRILRTSRLTSRDLIFSCKILHKERKKDPPRACTRTAITGRGTRCVVRDLNPPRCDAEQTL